MTFNYNTGATGTFPFYGYSEHSEYFSNPDPLYPNEKVFLGDWNLKQTSNNGTVWNQTGNWANPTCTLNYNNTSVPYNCWGPAWKSTFQKGSNAPAYIITKTKSCGGSQLPSFISKSLNGYNFTTPWYENYFSNVNQITNALYDQAKLAGAINTSDIPQISGISCRPDKGDYVYVTSSGLLPNFKVWRSNDGGINWVNTDPFGTFSKIPVFDVLAMEGNSDMVFVATLDGVYYTDNTMAGHWCRYGNSPSVQTLQLKYNPCKNKLIVTTYGRGAFEVDVPFTYFNPTNITANTTWSTPQTFMTSVTVKSGKTLTIQNTTIKFGPNSRLYVEAGAKLVINNAVLTSASACNGYLWKGIELQGDQNQKQILSGSYYPYHGWCVMTNNATIQNAEAGIKNYATVNGDGWTIDWTKLGGGVVECTNGKFLNCAEGGKFYPFTNKNALNQVVNDKSKFVTTQFLTDGSSSIPSFSPYSHLTMWGTRGITITSNTFKNVNPALFTIPTRGNGITAYDAIFTTNTPCLIFNGAFDCQTYGTPNLFENLNYGIDAGASVATTLVNVNVSKFVNTHRGIILRGTTQSSVFRNLINIGDGYTDASGAYQAPYGLYLDVCDAYSVKENTFNDNTNNATDVDYGIIVSNTGNNANQLKQNTFSNLAFGIQAQENNSNLQLKCNKFTAATINSADVKVMGLQMQGSVAQQQGLCSQNVTDLPGNEFSHTCGSAKDLNSNGNVSYQVTYNTRVTVSQEVPQSGCYNTTDFNVNLCNPAPSGVVCSPPTGGHLRLAQTNAGQQLQNMSSLIAAKQQLLADADAQTLYNSINNGTAETTVKQNLLQVGPYLSDNLLVAFLYHQPKYSNTTIKDVVMANSPVTATVMAAINQLSLPNTVKNQIASVQTGMSQRTYLENEIKYYTTSRVLLYNDIINDVLNDSTNTAPYDTLYTKLDFSISPQSRNLYISALMEQGKFGQAQAQIAIMRQMGEDAEQCDYWDAVWSLKQFSNKTKAYKTAAGIAAKLNPQLNKWPLAKSVNAQNINRALFGNRYNEKVYIDENSLKNVRYAKEETTPIVKEHEIQIIAYPNPANTHITFKIVSADNKNSCKVSLYDIRGEILLNFILDENEVQKTISLENLASGVYFYKLEANDRVLQTNKLIIIK